MTVTGGRAAGRDVSTRARRQAALIDALVSGEAAAAGFDPARLDAARRALMRKRAGEAAKEWPLLAASLGNEWIDVFARHRAGEQPVGGLREGWHVARALAEAGQLEGGATAELAHREIEWDYDGRTEPHRRVILLHGSLSAGRRR